MIFIQSIILGITQGLTEFLPVSSSGHLLIVPALFGWEPHSLVFDTTLHLGTSLALIIYFYNDLKSIVISFLSDFKDIVFKRIFKFSSSSVLGFKLVLGSFPAMVLGLLLNNYFETTFRAVTWVVVFLIVGSVLMYLAEYMYNKRGKRSISSIDELSDLPLLKVVYIGLFQSLALFPGFSRSGSTISGGMLLGLSKENAAKFSFLLSIPIILGVGIYQLISVPLTYMNMPSLLMGFVFSFLFGLMAIKFLLNFLKSNKLYPFIVYRVVLALFLFLFLSR